MIECDEIGVPIEPPRQVHSWRVRLPETMRRRYQYDDVPGPTIHRGHDTPRRRGRLVVEEIISPEDLEQIDQRTINNLFAQQGMSRADWRGLTMHHIFEFLNVTD